MGNGKKGSKSDRPISKQQYNDTLEQLQVELNNLARWVRYYNKRVLVLFEGRDTAGKGGVINAISECLSPRQCRVVALTKPTEVEKGQWYFQRYVEHLPEAGSITLMDRSWYNRAGVEKVMGYCSDDEYKRFMKQAPVFERLLVDDGIMLFKYWLTVDQSEQEKRFAERLEDPLKRWKLSPIDLEARQRYAAYGEARDAMLKVTHTAYAPWTLVDFNSQHLGRLTLIRHLLDRVPDFQVPAESLVFPPLDRKAAKEKFETALKPIKPIKLA
ncbi:MAG TPA: polyphosphate kinase 2 [Aquabacterium sp.]|uniref:polyphosphate kinase 2 n=1 Tax=Aquabacterium sp. TaxID=1872578 RepID=UPI002E32E4A9|nr:polyphosphate kinase 2 [Aquabacterium sp.]HEX5372637.1 polyphosphate kinase 2 [Aquabacterium sp.]